MTPLIDVVFQLIIFFLLSSSFVLQPGLRVELPAAHVPEGEKPAGPSVSILRDGRIFFDDREVTMAGLPEVLSRYRMSDEHPMLIIKADRKTAHGTVVEVMSLARKTGFDRISIATKPAFAQSDK